jgi:hypothetical protein
MSVSHVQMVDRHIQIIRFPMVQSDLDLELGKLSKFPYKIRHLSFKNAGAFLSANSKDPKPCSLSHHHSSKLVSV